MRIIDSSVLIAMLASCSAPAHTQDPVFVRAPSSPLTVGDGSGKIVLADLNRDGHLDLVTQHLLSGSVNVLIGDGKGHFAPAAAAKTPLKLGYQPGTIALGDVNNDSILDLAIANKDSRSEYINILLGDGEGGFTHALGAPLRASAAIEFYKPMLRLVDVNEDGNVDIVTANGRRPTVEVMLGNGAGGFAPASVLALGAGRGLGSFAIGDVDGDGHVDLVASSSGGPDPDRPGSLVTKRGDGTGSFTPASHAVLSLPPGAVLETLADVNGDQRLDAVIRYGERSLLDVFINEGKGTFASAPAARIHVEGDAFAVLVEDLNQDNIADLIVATVQSTAAPVDSKVAVFLGAGGGGRYMQALGSPFPVGPGAFNLAVGDVDEDGRLDVASSSFGGNAVTILLGRASPTPRS